MKFVGDNRVVVRCGGRFRWLNVSGVGTCAARAMQFCIAQVVLNSLIRVGGHHRQTCCPFSSSLWAINVDVSFVVSSRMGCDVMHAFGVG